MRGVRYPLKRIGGGDERERKEDDEKKYQSSFAIYSPTLSTTLNAIRNRVFGEQEPSGKDLIKFRLRMVVAHNLDTRRNLAMDFTGNLPIISITKSRGSPSNLLEVC